MSSLQANLTLETLFPLPTAPMCAGPAGLGWHLVYLDEHPARTGGMPAEVAVGEEPQREVWVVPMGYVVRKHWGMSAGLHLPGMDSQCEL